MHETHFELRDRIERAFVAERGVEPELWPSMTHSRHHNILLLSGEKGSMLVGIAEAPDIQHVAVTIVFPPDRPAADQMLIAIENSTV